MSKRNLGLTSTIFSSSSRRMIAVFLACLMGLSAIPGFASIPKPLDPEAVRVKVTKLGLGEHVMVKRTTGPTLHGNITGINREAFRVRPDTTQTEVEIPYAQVLKVRKNPGPITWMILGAILVVVVIVATR